MPDDVKEIDIYDVYKPLRNLLRKFSLVPSLNQIWLLSEHLLNNKSLPPNYFFTGHWGQRVEIKSMIYPWDLEILSREIILNAGNEENCTLSNMNDLAAVINLIRDIDNEISVRSLKQEDVMLELHRIIHRQLPW